MPGKKLQPIKQAVWGLLAGLVLFNTAGFWAVYKGLDAYLYYEHLQAKKAGIHDSNKLVTLSLDRELVKAEGADFTWVEDKEFRYQGRMYDVHSRTRSKDTITFRVERDRAEERLAAILLGKKQDNRPHEASLGWVKLLITQAIGNEGLALNRYTPGFELLSLFTLTPLLATPIPENPPPA